MSARHLAALPPLMLVATFVVAMVAPFQPAQSGGAGFLAAVVLVGGACLLVGFGRRAVAGALTGAAAGFAGLTLYVLGSYIVLDQHEWEENFGDSDDLGPGLVATIVLFWGPACAAIGAALGYAGSQIRRTAGV